MTLTANATYLKVGDPSDPAGHATYLKVGDPGDPDGHATYLKVGEVVDAVVDEEHPGDHVGHTETRHQPIGRLSDPTCLTFHPYQSVQNEGVQNDDPPGHRQLKPPERRPQRVRCGETEDT